MLMLAFNLLLFRKEWKSVIGITSPSVCIFGRWWFRFPVAQFPSGGCTASSLFFIFWEGVRKMMETGFSWVYNNYIINTENSLYCVQGKKHVKFSI